MVIYWSKVRRPVYGTVTVKELINQFWINIKMVQNVVTFVAIAIQTQTMDMIGKGKMVFLKTNNDDLHKQKMK